MPVEGPPDNEASIQNLANLLVLGRGADPVRPDDRDRSPDPGYGNRCGRAVFLVGAGCSVSAGIPLGAEVARRCASYLAGIYDQHDAGGRNRFWPPAAGGPGHDEALDWLRRNRDVPSFENDEGTDWGRYYKYFFEEHLSSINQQRAFIELVVGMGGDRLNWEHACLGELVARRYVHTVLTTNFDQLVLQGIIRTGLLPVVADGIEAVNRVTAEPRRPQIVHLHGSMHTYNPRNSQAAVSETDKDPTLRSMLYTILHRCDLLVVVGYAGGEEGVMRLLIEAARQLPPLVVYWVERDFDGELSPLAKQLMSIGENKLRLRGITAAELFQGLMNRLRIGEPAWMADPVDTLRRHREELVATSDVSPEVGQAIERFRRRVAQAEGLMRDSRPNPEDKAAALRLQGRYRESLAELASLGERFSEGLGPLALQATNRLSLAEEDPAEIEGLSQAVDDFVGLVRNSAGSERVRWAVQLFRALMLLYDRTGGGDPGGVGRIRDVLESVDRPADMTREAGDASVATDLHMLLGQAFQIMDDEGTDAEDINRAIEHFRMASGELKGSKDRRWVDVQAGLATSLQVRASREGTVDLAREAVSILQALVSTASGSNEDRAGRLMNLAGALEAQSIIEGPAGRPGLRLARDYVDQAIAVYRTADADASDDLDNARETRMGILRRLEH